MESTAMPAEEAALRPFLEWLARDGDLITDSMFEAVAASAPTVIGHGPNDAGSLRQALASHLPMIREARLPGTGGSAFLLPAPAARWARQLAQEGVDLSQLVAAYDAGARALWKAFADSMRVGRRITDSERADAFEITFDRIFRYLGVTLPLAVESYSAERDLMHRRDAVKISDLVSAALRGDISEAEVESASGYRLSANHVSFIVWSGNAVLPELNRVVAQLSAEARAWQTLAAPMEQRVVRGWFSSTDADAIARLAGLTLPADINVAVGNPHAGTSGFRVSHGEAEEVRRVSHLLRERPTGRAMTYAQTGTLSLLSQNADLARAFARERLGSLLEDRHSHVLETLAVWLHELGSPTRAARRLHVHVNTVVKRLERAEAVLGGRIDPSDFSLRVATELARGLDLELR
ncbi:PucR family transcriptional regulator [Microbacterium sp. RD1]|uniref:PucR family transcriptional regulator n=1 Tax=Microbacterium sp. RD1 TaxID=3457313 RepID=UPI003FA59F9A